jgi:hypothetical protein
MALVVSFHDAALAIMGMTHMTVAIAKIFLNMY